MKRLNRGTIIDALEGKPIADLIENWTFTMKEVAPYVFKAEGSDTNGRTAFGAGGTAEEALENCLIRADKIILHENRISKIKRVFGIKK